ncbi:MAG: sigma-70 family RNA polymerase sigma factor [Thermoanaerobaculia bacterium]|nr:sigma-70 family RNA polymerase sigma factor [Thermoanaerobaculia bacterium]
MSSRFETTQWSVVLTARDDGDPCARRAALETLFTAYWYPLYAYARQCGCDLDEARDVVQSFFADLLERQALRTVDPEKGRLRSFLLVSLRNFLSHERGRTLAAKRGGHTPVVSFDTEEAAQRFDREQAAHLTPEQVFERRWGLTVMERAMSRLKTQIETGARPEMFERLKPYLTGGDHASYRTVAAELSMHVGAVKVAVHRLRQSYGKLLRQELAQTLADPSRVDDELRYLLSEIRPWRG